MASLVIRNLLHDRVRLSVTLVGIVFSVVLTSVQLGLFFGFMRATSDLIDHSNADLWVLSKGVTHLETAVPFSEKKYYQVMAAPGVARVEKHMAGFGQWKKPDGAQEGILLIGYNLDSEMGAPWNLVEGNLASAEARLQQKEAELRRTVNGAREQERREAFAAIRESETTMLNARTEMERRRSLHRTGDIAREEVERAERQFDVATARFEAARQRHSFVDAAAREEDVARAQAEIELARAQIAEARAMLDKTVVRSPLDGVILRKHLKTGETAMSSQVGASQPIVTLADSSVLRVRVDVDEVDVARLQVGHAAYVTADAFGDRRFAGKVVRIEQVLGKKNIRTDDPAEKVETKILETLIELDAGNSLPLGLRVNAYISLDEAKS